MLLIWVFDDGIAGYMNVHVRRVHCVIDSKPYAQK